MVFESSKTILEILPHGLQFTDRSAGGFKKAFAWEKIKRAEVQDRKNACRLVVWADVDSAYIDLGVEDRKAAESLRDEILLRASNAKRDADVAQQRREQERKAEETRRKPLTIGENLTVTGVVLILLGGAIAAYFQFGFDPSVPLDSGLPDYSSFDSKSSPAERVVNLQKTTQQLMGCLSGEAIFIAGVLFSAAGQGIKAVFLMLQGNNSPR